jgi:hypothetical protein
VIGYGEINLQQANQGTEEPFGLTERKVEDHAKGQSCFDRDISIGALSAGFPAGRFPPGVDCIFREPDSQLPSPA